MPDPNIRTGLVSGGHVSRRQRLGDPALVHRGACCRDHPDPRPDGGGRRGAGGRGRAGPDERSGLPHAPRLQPSAGSVHRELGGGGTRRPPGPRLLPIFGGRLAVTSSVRSTVTRVPDAPSGLSSSSGLRRNSDLSTQAPGRRAGPDRWHRQRRRREHRRPRTPVASTFRTDEKRDTHHLADTLHSSTGRGSSSWSRGTPRPPENPLLSATQRNQPRGRGHVRGTLDGQRSAPLGAGRLLVVDDEQLTHDLRRVGVRPRRVLGYVPIRLLRARARAWRCQARARSRHRRRRSQQGLEWHLESPRGHALARLERRGRAVLPDAQLRPRSQRVEHQLRADDRP